MFSIARSKVPRSPIASSASCPKISPENCPFAYSDIAALAFTGRDTAAGKSFAAWVKKYNEKKAAGEKNIGIDAEPLD